MIISFFRLDKGSYLEHNVRLLNSRSEENHLQKRVNLWLLYCRKSLFSSAGISVCYHLWWKAHNRWYGMWFCYIVFCYESFLRSFHFNDTRYAQVSWVRVVHLFANCLKVVHILLLLSFWKWETRELEEGGTTRRETDSNGKYMVILWTICLQLLSNTPSWMFFTFFKWYKWCQIAQNV